MAWSAGRVIDGKYLLERPLGHGGMGSVWRALHVKLQQTVALKVIDVSGPSADKARKRFAKEARVAAAVRHRNVVYISDFGETPEGEPFMAMEILTGRTLFERLIGGPTLTVTELMQIAEGCLNGLAAVHDAGIIHRDIKPQNIFLVRDPEGDYPKLLDFGLSREAGPGSLAGATRDGAIVGTLEYMPPEQARGKRELDPRSDLYAMGAVLYEALTGEPPFIGETPADLVVAILQETIVPLHAMRPELGKPLSEVLDRALSREPEARFESARAMRDALRDALAATPEAGAQPLPETFATLRRASEIDDRVPPPAATELVWSPEATSPVHRAAPSKTRLWAGLGAALVAAIGGAMLFAYGGHGGETAIVGTPTAPRRLVDPAAAPALDPKIRVELVGVPPNGRVLVDGQPTTALPLVLERDGRLRTIEVLADGSLPWRIGHAALVDARYDVQLQPTPAAPATAKIRTTGTRRPSRTPRGGTGGVVRQADF